MRKLLVADDNPWDRDGVKGLIDWNALGVQIVGDCANGRAALDLVSRLGPDIVLSDVVMPVMNGIEMATALRASHPSVRIIFMSAYHEFEFARSALDLEAYGYVLKPIAADELQAAVRRTLEDLEGEALREAERRQVLERLALELPYLREQFFRDLLFGVFSADREVAEQMRFLKLPYSEGWRIRVAVLRMHGPAPGIDDRYAAVQAMKRLAAEAGDEKLRFHPVHTAPGELALVLLSFADREVPEKAIDRIIEVREELGRRIRIGLTVGVSRPSEGLLDAPMLYSQAAEAAGTGFYGERPGIVCYEEIAAPPEDADSGAVDFRRLYQDLRDCVSVGDDQSIHTFLATHLGKAPVGQDSADRRTGKGRALIIASALQALLIEGQEPMARIFGAGYNPWAEIDRLSTAEDVDRWLANLLRSVKAYLQRKHESVQDQIVRRIRDTVSSRYREPLTVRDIAESVHFSAVHANNIFKRNTGKTIFDYLTEYRMERAKELLRDPLAKIYLVAAQVGYSNTSHFCLLFRKHAGVSPSEFKRRVAL